MKKQPDKQPEPVIDLRNEGACLRKSVRDELEWLKLLRKPETPHDRSQRAQ